MEVMGGGGCFQRAGTAFEVGPEVREARAPSKFEGSGFGGTKVVNNQIETKPETWKGH